MTVSYASLGIKLSSIIQASTLAPTLNHPIDIAVTSTSNGSSASKQLNGGWFDVQLKTISQCAPGGWSDTEIICESKSHNQN